MKRLAIAAALLVLPACMTLDVSVDEIGIPIRADRLADSSAEEFRIRAKHVLWVHGLFGSKKPDVTQLVTEAAGDARAIDSFRVRQQTNIYDWLGTHLSLSLVRLKTVWIEGRRIPSPADGRVDASADRAGAMPPLGASPDGR